MSAKITQRQVPLTRRRSIYFRNSNRCQQTPSKYLLIIDALLNCGTSPVAGSHMVALLHDQYYRVSTNDFAEVAWSGLMRVTGLREGGKKGEFNISKQHASGPIGLQKGLRMGGITQPAPATTTTTTITKTATNI